MILPTRTQLFSTLTIMKVKLLGDGYTHFCMGFVNRQLMTGNENQVQGTKMITREMVRCVVVSGIIQFTTSAFLLVTAEHADQFVK
jgi:hypothetical protein